MATATTPAEQPRAPGRRPDAGRRPRRGRAAGVAALVVVVGLVLLQRLDAALAAMHRPGQPSTSASGLASPFTFRDQQTRLEAVRAWQGWDEALRNGGTATASMWEGGPLWDSGPTLWCYAAIDSTLVAVGLAVLLHAAWRSAQRPGSACSPDPASARRGLLRTVPPATVVYVVADVVENALLVVTREAPSTPALVAVDVASSVKWLALSAAALPLAVAGIAHLRERQQQRSALSEQERDTRATLVDEVVALRAQVVTALLLLAFVALPGDLGQQVDDAVLALSERPIALLATVLAALGLTFLLWATGRLCLAAHRSSNGGTAGPRSVVLVVVAAVGAVSLGVGIHALVVDGPLVAAAVPGGLLLVFAALSLPVRRVALRTSSDRVVPDRLLAWLTAAPALALGLVALRSGLLVLVTGEVRQALDFIVLGLVGLAAAAGLAPLRPPRLPEAVALAAGVVAALALPAGLVLAGAAAADPVQVGRTVGAWALVLVFLAVLLCLLTTLVLVGDLLPAAGVLAVVGLRRVPLVSALLVCAVATSAVDDSWRYHDVRRTDAGPVAVSGAGVTLETALQRWHAGGGEAAGHRRPLVLVAASGGGIRAAYWTTAALACLLHGDAGDLTDVTAPQTPADAQGTIAPGELPAQVTAEPAADGSRPTVTDAGGTCERGLGDEQRRDFFAASGISGSSLGLAVTRALDDRPSGYTRALAKDFLGSTMAGYLFRDAPNSVLRRLPVGDRAEVTELAWEEAVRAEGGRLDCPFLTASRVDGVQRCDAAPDGTAALRFPLLLLNSVGADDGCRLTTSTLDLAWPVRPEPTAATGRAQGPGSGSTPPLGPEDDCRSLAGATRTPLQASGVPDAPPALAATRDVHDYSCDPGDRAMRDLPLSAAAHLSARFPWVSPSGRLDSCSHPDHSTYALDGGVVDSSGASPLLELLPTVLDAVQEWNATRGTGPCVVPRLLLLDNGYTSLAARDDASRPLEVTAPVEAVGAVQGQRSATARQALVAAVQRASADSGCGYTSVPAVAHLFPVAHPGPQAPLGWTLSTYSRDDLREQLGSPHNACQAAVFRAWFDATAGWSSACQQPAAQPGR